MLMVYFWILIAVALFVLAAGVGYFFGRQSQKSDVNNSRDLVKTAAPTAFPVTQSAALEKRNAASKARQDFCERLQESLAHEYYVLSKVRVRDIVEQASKNSKGLDRWMRHNQFDCVLFRKEDMKAIGAIELEGLDRSGPVTNAKARSAYIESICESANLKLFFFDVRQSYQDKDIRWLVLGEESDQRRQNTAVQPSSLTVGAKSISEIPELRSCPKCKAEVVLKMATKGDHIGEKFLMCRKYPYCDYQISVNDEKVLKIVRAAEARAPQDGYKAWS